MNEEKTQPQPQEGAAPAPKEDIVSQILSQVDVSHQQRVKDELKEYVDSITKGKTVAVDALNAIDVEIARIDE